MAAHTFDIRLFGAIEIYRDGRPLTKFRSQKTLTLLAYLIVQARPLARDRLAGLFWPEAGQKQALGHLRRALHDLGKKLPGCLDVNRRTAAFHLQAPAVVDVRRFQTLVAQKEANSLAEAAALARAPFLEGVYFADCPELEMWIAAEQERWQQQIISLLETLAGEMQQAGEYGRALAYARQLAGFDPLDEANQRRIMLLLAKTGRRPAALAQYEKYRQLLAAELDVLPAPETEALYQRLRQTTAVPHNLPPSPTPFIGRKAELAALRRRLAHPDCRLITIVGPGGIGKTRLALELARQNAGRYLEGVCFVSLAGARTPESLLTALGDALDLPFTPGGDPASQLLDYLRDKELLLVLDNFEQLADAPNLLADIWQKATAVQLLVTSRRPLNLQEEWLFDLDGLSWPQADTASDPLAYEAPQLFAAAAHRRSARFDLAANSAAVLQICQMVEGSPLALEMAAAACRAAPCAHVAAAIGENLDILQSPLHNVPERQRSVEAVFDYSWRLLDSEAQAAYARLSIFQGSFSLTAAQKVTAVTPAVIQQLAEHSLLKQTDSAGRYKIHALLRHYARQRLAQNPAQANRIAFRHAAWFTERLAKYGANPRRETRAAVSANPGDVVAAWQWAAGQGQWELLAQGGRGLTTWFLDTGSSGEGILLLDEALAHLKAAQAEPARQPPPPAALRGQLLAHKAHLLARRAQSDAARRAAQQALELLAAAPHAPAQVESMYALAYADFDQGNYQTARKLAEEGLALARQNGLERLAVLCLNHAGRCCLQTGEMAAAQAYFAETAVLAQMLSFPQYEVSAGINLSLVESYYGRYPAAETLLRQALALSEREEYRTLLGTIHLNLGTACLHQGKYAAGREHYQAAQYKFQQSGNRHKLGLSYHAQASVSRDMGDFAAAQRSFAQALSLYRQAGIKHNQLIILSELGELWRLWGNYPAARQHLREALKLSQEIGAHVNRLNLHTQAAWLAVEIGDITGAQAELARVTALLPDEPPVEYEGPAYMTLCRFWQFQGDLAEACRYGQRALQLARQQNQRMLPDCAVRQGYVLLALGEETAARRLFAEALQIRQERGQTHLAVEAHAGLARATLLAGNLAEALEQVEAVLRFLDGAKPPNTLVGTQEPALIYLTCYDVLQAAEDPRADAILAEGYAFLRERAATLDEAERQLFWENVPPHRELAAAV